MTNKQPDPLRVADELLNPNEWFPNPTMLEKQAANLLRTQHAEIERLSAAIKWEQNRAERIGTHGPGCEKWGSAHFECALRAIERKDALLRQALEALASAGVAMRIGHMRLQAIDNTSAAVEAITKELQ